MIITPRTPAPEPGDGGTPPPAPKPDWIRIDRVITIDSTGDERWWDLADLRVEHPELFA